jgi:hypothetical protein
VELHAKANQNKGKTDIFKKVIIRMLDPLSQCVLHISYLIHFSFQQPWVVIFKQGLDVDLFNVLRAFPGCAAN